MRYVLNFNPEGTESLIKENGARRSDDLTLVLKKNPVTLKNGATTKVKVLKGTGGRPFTPRGWDDFGLTSSRFGTVISSDEAREFGVKGRKRYLLEKAGKTGWFNLVPHSNIVKGKAKRIEGPGLSVSIIER